MLTVACEHCGRTIAAADASTQCPSCGQSISNRSDGETLAVDPSAQASTHTHIGEIPSSKTVAEPVPGGTIPGYTIVEELGRGGMGVVYKAREVSLNRAVALKVLLAGTHAGSRELARFRAEAEAAAAVQHPNIVQVFAVGQHAGLPYLALEFVPGGSLADRLVSGRLDPKEAAQIVRAIARGVHAAHEKGVIHRDLKPANILFDSTGEPKVADFGLAKMEDTGLTASGAIMGTPAYMAPEQARGDTKTVGPAADIWALGAILYECVSGRQPFRGQSAPETLRLVGEADPAPLRGIPKNLATIVAKCLEKQPAQRYTSAGELVDDLARFLAGEAVTARRRSSFLQPSRWVARHRKLSYALAGASLALAAILFVLWIRPKQELSPTLLTDGKPNSDLLLIPPDAFAFITIRPGNELDRPEVQRLVMSLLQLGPDVAEEGMLRERIESLLGLRPEEIERFTFVLLHERFRVQQAAPNFLIVLRTKSPANLKTIRNRIEDSLGTFDPEEHRGHKYDSVLIDQRTLFSLWKAGDKDLVFGQSKDVLAAINRLEDGQAETLPTPALELASKGHSIVASTRSMKPLLEQLNSEWPRELLATLELLVQSGSATFTLDLLPAANTSPVPGFDAEIRFSFTNEAGATSVLPKLRTALISAGKPDSIPTDGGLQALLPALRASLREVSVRQEQSVLVVSIRPRWTASEIVTSAKKPSASVGQKLQQIGLAMYNYDATFGRLPKAAIHSPQGKPLLSWRVELLPFVEHDSLYREFNPKEAWDHPDNKRLLEKMPAIFGMDPTDPGFAKNRTRFQVIQAKGGVFDGDTATQLAQMKDGSSNTLLVLEAGESIEWTKPDQLRFDPKGAMPKLGNPAQRECLILLGDASIQPISRDVSAEAFGPLVTKNGNDSLDWLRLRGKRP